MSDQKGTRPPLDTWAVVELMGHVRLAGHVTEEERFGVKMGRVEIPLPDGKFATQYFGGGSVYRISPVSEEVARSVALNTAYMPVNCWELPRPALAAPSATRTKTKRMTNDLKPEFPQGEDRRMSCGHTPEDCDCDPDEDEEDDEPSF